MPKCTQCDKPAFAPQLGIDLCLEHYSQFVHTNQIVLNNLSQFADYLRTQGLMSMGFYPPFYPTQLTTQPPPTGATMTFNNFNIDNSTIGAINTGRIRTLDIAIDAMKQQKPELTSLLKQFTQAVINDNNMPDATRDQILEYTSFLANQVAVPKEMRNPTIANDVLDKTHKTITALAGLLAIWTKIEPLIRSALGF